MNRPTRELTLEAMSEDDFLVFADKVISRVRKGDGRYFPLEDTVDEFVQRQIGIYEVLERLAHLAFNEGAKSRQHEIDELKSKSGRKIKKPSAQRGQS